MTLSDLLKADNRNSSSFASLLPPTPSTNNIFTQNPSVPSIFGTLPPHNETQHNQSPQHNRNAFQSPPSNNTYVPPPPNQPVPSFMGRQALMQFTPSSPTGKSGSGNIFSAPGYDRGGFMPQSSNAPVFTPNPNAAKMFENNVFMSQPVQQPSLFGSISTPPQTKDYTPRGRSKKPVRIG